MPRRTPENVIKAFLNGGSENYFTSNKSLYIDDDRIMSYGSHFTLVRRYHDRKEPLYIINSSKSSKTTMGHATKCWQKIHKDKHMAIVLNDEWGQGATEAKAHGVWGETKFCTKGLHPDSPRASRDEAVKSFHENLEYLYRARASYRRQALVSIIGERVKSIRLLEEYFDLDTVELEIHKRMISRLVKWRLEGEPIMGNWKSLMERLNGRREEQAAA